MSVRDCPTGLVPRALRPAARLRPEAPPAAGAEAPAGRTETAERAKPPKPLHVPRLTPEEMRENHRRFFAAASPDAVAIRRRLSNALGFAAICSAAACQRAKSCQGVGSAVCLFDHRDIALPVLARALDEADGREEDE